LETFRDDTCHHRQIFFHRVNGFLIRWGELNDDRWRGILGISAA
jgi:hypothetical protein